MSTSRVTSAVSMIAAAFVAIPSEAEQKDASVRVVNSFVACRSIADPPSRLACFDRATAALEESVKANDVHIIDRADIRKARRSLFGLSVPALSVLGDGPDENKRDVFTEISAAVAGTRANRGGRIDITLSGDDGAIWQVTDPMPFPPKAGAEVRIRKGAMGGFFLNVGGRSYRAIRIR
ncbi:hypothetical protein [Sphingomonas endophytica]|uniref:hypothetical protein n=1 Tax=Sphingomonas endophytica TaxID=869719 RepID=UPI00128FC566|nr:hypothetical protein [Sphingomonas endophytica]